MIERCPRCGAIGRGDGTYLCGGPNRACSDVGELAERWLASAGIVGKVRRAMCVAAKGHTSAAESLHKAQMWKGKESVCEPRETAPAAGTAPPAS